MNITRQLKLFLIILLAFLVTACGFKLRGAANLPHQLHTLYVDHSGSYTQLTRQLTDQLKFSGIHVVDAANQAPITLAILKETITTRQISVGSSQMTRDYSVNYSVQYNLQDSTGNIIFAPTSVTEQKLITLNPQEVLSNSNKEAESKELMRRDMIDKILFQLSSQSALDALKKAEHLQVHK